MPTAKFNNTVIAESDETIVVDGNHYFPPTSVKMQYMERSDTTTVCPWKGTASYYTVAVDGKRSVDAAWYYPQCKDEAKHFENYVAFWKDVDVQA